MKIFIASMPFSVRESDVFDAFSKYGMVSSVKIITDKITGKSRGFGFVEMPNELKAIQAVTDLDGAEVEGRAIVVRVADERDGNRLSPAKFSNDYDKTDDRVYFNKKQKY